MGAGASVKRSKVSMRSEIVRLQERELNIMVNPMLLHVACYLIGAGAWLIYFLFNIGGARKVPRIAGGEDGSLYNAAEK